MTRRIKWNRQINDPRFWAACAECGADVGPFRFYAQAEGRHVCGECKPLEAARLEARIRAARNWRAS